MTDCCVRCGDAGISSFQCLGSLRPGCALIVTLGRRASAAAVIKVSLDVTESVFKGTYSCQALGAFCRAQQAARRRMGGNYTPAGDVENSDGGYHSKV